MPKTAKVVAPKDTSVVPYRRLSNKELEEMCRKFYEEPTQDDFSRVFEEGLADGTIVIDEDDLEIEYAEEPDSIRFTLYSKSSFFFF